MDPIKRKSMIVLGLLLLIVGTVMALLWGYSYRISPEGYESQTTLAFSIGSILATAGIALTFFGFLAKKDSRV